MPVTLRNTDILFNDGTTQTTAAYGVTTYSVLNATAGASAGDVGTYAVRRSATSSGWSSGSTVSGSTVGGLSGTWRAMGPSRPNEFNKDQIGVYLRIS